jgi:hypothetical protein
MAKFPVDSPRQRVVRALEEMVREGNHIAMVRENVDGTKTPLTMPNHRRIKSSTPRTMLSQSGIPRREFSRA